MTEGTIKYEDTNTLGTKVKISKQLVFDVPYDLISTEDIEVNRVFFPKGEVISVTGMLAEKCMNEARGKVKLYEQVAKVNKEKEAIKKMIKEEMKEVKVKEPEAKIEIKPISKKKVVKK